MATFIAKQLVYAGRLVQPGEEYEIDLLPGQLPPPEDVAVPKDADEAPAKKRKSAE